MQFHNQRPAQVNQRLREPLASLDSVELTGRRIIVRDGDIRLLSVAL
ncbi:MAG: hypothetical protein IID46_08075 [Planctomycetes bacterium]|nr:hypothetical protein [Planctomycetota bacterium]